MSARTATRTERILVVVLSGHAQQDIVPVLERVPQELYSNGRVHFLCLTGHEFLHDFGSRVSEWVCARGIENVTVLGSPENPGYVPQKLAFRIAIDGGFDFVIPLRAEAEFAPELLPDLIDTWDQSGADVVLGSRRSARRGSGFRDTLSPDAVGNRVVTAVRNRLTGQRISDYGTENRGYSTRFLRKVPFELNANGFQFDTELLLQAAFVDARIEEFPVAACYGRKARACAIKYAIGALISTVQFKMHSWGMFCSLKYRDLRPARYPDKTRMLYSSHVRALEIVRRAAPRTVLDIGCGAGFVARECESLGARVTGIDMREPLPGAMSEFHLVDLEIESLPVDAFEHGMVLMLDIVEHLKEPEQFLIKLRNETEADEPGALVLSTPNIAFAGIRLNLLLGRFTYGERGILDITHKRLFTRRSLRRMLRDCGYDVESMRGIGVPFETVLGGRVGRLLGTVADWLAQVWPTMFAFQFMVVCRPAPSPRRILRQLQWLRTVEADAELTGVTCRPNSLAAAAHG